MSISATRHKFLDLETSLGTLDLREIVNSDVYTGEVDKLSESISSAFDTGSDLLDKFSDKLNNLESTITEITAGAAKMVSKAIDSVLDTLNSIEMPGFVKDAMAMLKGLNLDGVKSFLKTVTRIGSAFLCNNLDLLKNFMLGYSLSRNILAGLMLGLLLSWADQFCKGYSQAETFATDNRGLSNMLVKYAGVSVSPTNIVSKFGSALSGYFGDKAGPVLQTAMSVSSFTDAVVSGQPLGPLLVNLTESELTVNQRTGFLSDLSSTLGNFAAGSKEQLSLLSARAGITEMLPISQARRTHVASNSGSVDALGSLSKNLLEIDLDKINVYSLSESEKETYGHLVSYKSALMTDTDIKSRDHTQGSFQGYDFESKLPIFTPGQVTGFTGLPKLDESHRYNGIHPTTEVFIDDNVGNVGKSATKPTGVSYA